MTYKKDLFDYLALGYLISHIPITLFVDGQALIPSSWYPGAVPKMLSWYVGWSHDPLMDPVNGQPLWFKSIISAELFLQVPYFLMAVYAWLTSSNWIRIPTIVYGAHTATTLIPILATIALHADLTNEQKAMLVAIYIPYLLMPLALIWRAASRAVLFPDTTKALKKA